MMNKINLRIVFAVFCLITCSANLGYSNSLTYCVNEVHNRRTILDMGLPEEYQSKKVVLEGKGYVEYTSMLGGEVVGKNYNAKDDFVGELLQESSLDLKDKKKFFAQLNKVVKSGSSYEKLVDAYNGIFYAPEAWDDDVIKWLEPRVDTLPAPFYMLLGYKYAKKDIDKFLIYYDVHRLQALLDIASCNDQSVQQALDYINLIFIFENYKKNQSLASDKDINQKKMQAFFQELSKDDAVYRKVASEIFEKRKIKRSDSFWVYNHGMSHMKAVLKGEKEDVSKQFKSLSEMQERKEKLLELWRAKS